VGTRAQLLPWVKKENKEIMQFVFFQNMASSWVVAFIVPLITNGKLDLFI